MKTESEARTYDPDDTGLIAAAPLPIGACAEIVLTGLGVSPGIAIGRVHLAETGRVPVSDAPIAADMVADELDRLDRAVATARAEIAGLQAKAAGLPAREAEDVRLLLDAHLEMLAGSRLIREARAAINIEHRGAAIAIRRAGAALGAAFEALGDAYLAARGRDVRDVAERVVRALVVDPEGEGPPGLADLPPDGILVTQEVSPADAALMDPQRVPGFVAEDGGVEGHASIMARALGIPAVLGATGVVAAVSSGDCIIIDGVSGRVVINPTPETLASYRARQDQLRQRQAQLARLKMLPAVTRDGHKIKLLANLDLAGELEAVSTHGAEGIGLLRTEFLYMNRDDLPGEEEQFALLAAVVRSMGDRPVTVRTLDVGGEKTAPALAPLLGDCENPALGLRAIRLSLRHPELLETQLRAMLRAAALATPDAPMRVLLPMVTTVAEIVAVRGAMRRCAQALTAEGKAIPHPLPPIGAMIEVPGAALSADALAQEADFFALGTNDLTMYTLAIDRADEEVANLYTPLHPAVLRLIQFTVEAALRARIPVSVCGEIAGDPKFTGLLVGLGVKELSMSPPSIPAVKQRVRGFDLGSATRRALQIMDQADPVRIRALLDDFNAHIP